MIRAARARRSARSAFVRSTLTALSLAALSLTFLGACATRTAELPPFPESLLLVDYTSWFAVDVAGNRELIGFVLEELDSDLAGVVARTTRIVGGARLLPGEPADFSAVASGDFPRGGVEFALRRDDAFERYSVDAAGGRAVYFVQSDSRVQLALPANDLLYLSSARVLDMLEPRAPAELEMRPDVYRALRRVGTPFGPDALVVLEEPGRGALQALGVDAGALPLQRISLSITNGADGTELELGGSLTLRSEREAALFGRIGRLFVLAFVRALGLQGTELQSSLDVQISRAEVLFSGIPVQREELTGVIRRLGGSQ